MKFKIYFDGACRPINPGGVMGYGYIIKNENDETVYSFSDWQDAHPANTTPKAEVTAAYKALEYLFDVTPREDLDKISVEVFGDNRLVCGKMNSDKKAFSGEYAEIAENLHHLVRNSFKSVRFTWIPREENVEADALSTDALCRNNRDLCQ